MDHTDPEEAPHHLTVGGKQVDQLLSVLEHRYRRYIIQRLRTTDRLMTLDLLALEIAARERDKPVDSISLETADEVRTTLHHAHLPKLADASLIEYDTATGEVRLTDRTANLEPLLRAISDSDTLGADA